MSDKNDKLKPGQKKRTIFSTKVVEEMIRDMDRGIVYDDNPFFNGDTKYKAANVIFQMTEQEKDEYVKCSASAVYFIEHYVPFENDHGITLVKLRDYQEDFIHLLCDEYWDGEYGEFMPENRNVISMQSRQNAKCFTKFTKVVIENTEIPIYKLYYQTTSKKSYKEKLSFIIDNFNYKIFNGKCNLLNILSHSLEKIIFKKYTQNEKIIESRVLDKKLKSEVIYNHGTYIHRTKEFEIYELKLEDEHELLCADNHLVLTKNGWKYVKDLVNEDEVRVDTCEEWTKVKSVKNTKKNEYMYDISIEEDDHSYYTNGILSHNTTTMAAAFLWYGIFHNDRHMAIVANKGETMFEIFRKMDAMLGNIPFFLKPGIIAKNMSGMSFDNGCFYKGFNCSKTPSIGFTTHWLAIDEAALIPQNIMNDFWTAIYPTLSASKLSKIVLTSTPRGRQNKFYELWDKGERGLNSFKTFRVDWWQNPDHDEAWAEQQRKDFGEIEFAQEFELQWDVAASKVVRGTDMQFMKRIKKTYVNKDIDTIPEDVCKHLWWDPDFDPDSVVRKRQKVFINIDTAEGKELTVQGKSKADYNVMQIYVMELMSPIKVLKFALDKKIKWSDIFRFRQVGVYMDNNNDEEAMAKAAKYLVYGTFRCGKTESQGVVQRGLSMLGLGSDQQARSIDNVRILLEMNFNGKNFLNLFKDSDWWYDSIVLKTYHQKPVPGVAQKKKFGYKTTSGGNGIGKSYFCEEGAKMLTKRQIIVNHWNPDDPNECTISELGAFDKIKKSTVSKFYQYEGVGLHDDLAKTVLDCSRAVEIEEFVLWLQEYFEEEEKIREGEGAWKHPLFQRLMNISVDTDEGELTDDEFVAMYTDGGATAGNTFARMNAGFPTVNGSNGIVPGSTYGSMMYRNTSSNPYINRQSSSNPYTSKRVVNPYTRNRNIPGGIEGFGKF